MNINNNNKNKISTFSYFLKRLRDSGFIAIKLFRDYGQQDPRKWSVMVDPSGRSLIITCYQNKEFDAFILGFCAYGIFDFTNMAIFKNYNLKTSSMEIIITTLIEKMVPQKYNDHTFLKKEESIV